jgi:hypothetical protein
MSACACECDGTPPDAPGNKGGARADETRGPGNGQAFELHPAGGAREGNETRLESMRAAVPCPLPTAMDHGIGRT